MGKGEDAGEGGSTVQPTFSGQTAFEAPGSISLGSFGEQSQTGKPDPFGQETHPMLQGNAAPLGQSITPDTQLFRWSQFFLGLFLPIVIVVCFIMLARSFENDRWENMYDSQNFAISPDENGHYSQAYSVPDGYSLEYCGVDSSYAQDEQEIYCQMDYEGPEDRLEIWQEQEFVPKAHNIQFDLDGPNGTFSVSFEGANASQVTNMFGEIYDGDDRRLSSISQYEYTRGNTSYVNQSFTPQNESVYVYLTIHFRSPQESIFISHCGACEGVQHQENHRLVVSSTAWRDGAVIGEYTPGNSTVWFVPNGTYDSPVEFYIESYNFEGDEEGQMIGEVIEVSVCLMPLIYVGAIIVAFVRGNKGLGWGLISSGVTSVFLIGAFIVFLIAAFSGGF